MLFRSPFDLSQVMFITTCNWLDPVPEPLKDRMEIITLPGYTLEEKVQIASIHLIPRQLTEHGLDNKILHFSEDAIKQIIKSYTREAGVRNLEREVSHVCRKIAREIADGEKGSFHVKATSLTKYLGPEKYMQDEALQKDEVGVAQGLAWTQFGGALLQIETTKIPGMNGIKVTGQLGDIMKESVQAALSYVQAMSQELNINPDDFKNNMLHIHLPAAAVPKDGPSAGITLATALASLMSNRKVNCEVAMTGEITLRGHVLPVGGIKEKVLAAYRSGIKTIILPAKNKNDLADIPAEVKRKIQFHLVDSIQEVFKLALIEPEPETEKEETETTKSEKETEAKQQRA